MRIDVTEAQYLRFSCLALLLPYYNAELIAEFRAFFTVTARIKVATYFFIEYCFSPRPPPLY